MSGRALMVARHGPEFTDTMAALASYALGPEVGFILRAGYAEAGVRPPGDSGGRATSEAANGSAKDGSQPAEARRERAEG